MSNRLDRLGTANMYDGALRNLAARQRALADLQQNLTSGRRVLRASDDPVAAAQAERALNRIARIQCEQRTLSSARNAVTQGEAALGDAVELVQNFRALVVGAGNASLKPQDRATIAQQLQGLREQLLEVVNRQDSNGMPLLGALGSAQLPFQARPQGAPGERFAGQPGQGASNGVGIAATLDGHAALMFEPQRDGVYTAGVSAIPNHRQLTTSVVRTTDPRLVTGDDYRIVFSAVGPGATPGTSSASYTVTNTTTGAVLPPVVVPDYPSNAPTSFFVAQVPGLDLTVTGNPANRDTITLRPSAGLLDTLARAVSDIRSAPNGNAAIQAVGQALGNIDTGLERLHNSRGYAGELLNRAERIASDLEKRSIALEAERARAQDLDMLEGISNFQNQQLGQEAALKSYAKVQRLSLLDFI